MRGPVTGMGGEIGVRVTNLLERDARVEAVLGVDIDPPRRRLHRAEFRRVDPRTAASSSASSAISRRLPSRTSVCTNLNPRCAGPALARSLTREFTIVALGAAGTARTSIASLCVPASRSMAGREDPPRGRTRPSVPLPTTPFGRSLLEVEVAARDVAMSVGAALTLVRCAPIVGPHMSSPLGRLLRLPLVPMGALSDLPFSLLHQDDAAVAFIRALDSSYDGPVNVVASGRGDGGASGASRWPACGSRSSGRNGLRPAPSPKCWAPLPPHVQELLTCGRTADGTFGASLLGLDGLRSTLEIVEDLYDWAAVTILHGEEAA